MQTITPTRYQTPRQHRPRCPAHGCLLRVESSRGPIAYTYCPRRGCSHRAKLVRELVVAASRER
jgi:hypothetical protein